MCGIAGVFDLSGRERASEEGLRRMLAMLRHRGPDEFGVLLDGEAGLGSARLSIIDLGGGGQPIANADGTLWIVFNGEVFNYVELRAELEALGHRFRTATDTEVVLQMYERHGPACLERLNGQFAIAIWDSRRRRLFLGRDRLGVRPLFYTQTPGRTLIFASEIKAILSDRRVRAEIDPAAIRQTFLFWAPLAPSTAFKGIVELPPGHYLTADERGVEVRRYWAGEYPDEAAPERPFGEAVEEFRSLLTDACRIRLRADVPVGAYLSGGIDSSSIASIVRGLGGSRLSTFSIAFDDARFDESSFQREMSAHLGTEHHAVRATVEDIGRVFPEVVWHAEVPLMRTAAAPMFLLSRLVRERGFKVVLTGEGADELLAGYDIFKEAKARRFWARRPGSKWRPLLLKRLYPDIGGMAGVHQEVLEAFFGEGLADTSSPWYSHAVRWRNNLRTCRFLIDEGGPGGAPFAGPHFERLAAGLPAGFDRWDPLSRAQHLETSIFLSHYLLSSQGDRMGMAHSIEGRFPFLDVRLTEFCNRLPPRHKMRGLREKRLLKAAARPWLPDLVRDRPKRPYRAPVHRSFFHAGAPDYVRELLEPAALKDAGLFRPSPAAQLARKIASGAPVGETDDMALSGILSTQLLHRLFVKDFRGLPPLGPNDRVKVCAIPANREARS